MLNKSERIETSYLHENVLITSDLLCYDHVISNAMKASLDGFATSATHCIAYQAGCSRQEGDTKRVTQIKKLRERYREREREREREI
jgi:hypothetical protein